MNWFKKQRPEMEDDTPPAPKNPDNAFIFRLVAVAYVLYLVWQSVQSYLAGGEGAPSLIAVILSCALLGGGAIFLGILSYRNWKTDKAAYREYLAEEAAAEAAEEASDGAADDWDDEDWDVDPDEVAAEAAQEE